MKPCWTSDICPGTLAGSSAAAVRNRSESADPGFAGGGLYLSLGPGDIRERQMPVDALPPELQALRTRLRSFLHDELLPAEREKGIIEEADATPELRRWVRTRSNELGLF